MKKITTILCAIATMVAVGCNTDTWPAQPDWDSLPDPSNPQSDGLMWPAECNNKISAHMCGATEAGLPANSIAALKYAKSLGVYGAECDVYWTKDDNVVVGHANGLCEINGRAPYKATLAELRVAGKLSNGEQLPTLQDMIKEVMVEGCCTRLMVDVKKINYPVNQPQYVINCARRVCEIVEEMGAKHFVHIHCTGFNDNAMKSAWGYAQDAGLEISMNSGKSPESYGALGFNWINLAAATQMGPEAGGTGSYTLKSYLDAGIAVSVYNVDKQAGDGNAVYSNAAVAWYLKNYSSFKSLCTNYPAWLLDKVSNVSTRFDGISNQDEFEQFVSSCATDPTGSAFANDDGVVVLKADVSADDFTPIKEFSGILDGGGHTITLNYKGAATDLGFFKSLNNGTVKNLVIAGSFESTCADGAVNIGAFAATSENAVFDNCVNKARITVNSESSSATIRAGGIVGSAAGDCTFKSCRDEGGIVYNSGAALFYGGIFGANAADDGHVKLVSCSSSSTIDFNGSNASAWNYVGGLAGKPASKSITTSGGTDYRLTFDRCSYTGTFNVTGGGKIRAGMISSYSNSSFIATACTASGTIKNTNTSARDFVVASIMGFVEKNVEGLLEQCSFTGRIESVAGANNYIGGVLGNTADNAAVVCDNCTTGKTAYVGADAVKSVGMLAGRPKTAGCTVRNCKIAGTINKAGTVITISPDNIDNWMFIGSGTNAANVAVSGNSFNQEQ